MEKNKIIKYLSKKKEEGKIASCTLYTALFFMGGAALALSYNPNPVNEYIAKIDEDLKNNQEFDSKILKASRLIKVENTITKEIKIHLCSIDFQNSDSESISYREVGSNDLIATIPTNQDSIEQGINIKTDMGLYADKSGLPIVDGLSYKQYEVQKDIKAIETEEKKKNNNVSGKTNQFKI